MNPYLIKEFQQMRSDLDLLKEEAFAEAAADLEQRVAAIEHHLGMENTSPAAARELDRQDKLNTARSMPRPGGYDDYENLPPEQQQ